jgi:hypothetical protein
MGVGSETAPHLLLQEDTEMKKIDMSQVAQDIKEGKYGIDQVEKDIEAGRYDWEDVCKMPYEVELKLSRELASQKYESVMARLEFEPRDWTKLIPLEDRHACGIRGEEYYRIEYITVGRSEGVVAINDTLGRCETFRTREKLDSFIDTLLQFRDEAFPVGEAQ